MLFSQIFLLSMLALTEAGAIIYRDAVDDSVSTAFSMTEAAGGNSKLTTVKAAKGGKNDTTKATAKNATATGKIIFDARVKESAKVADFDTTTNVFKSDNVKGAGQTFSELISFPDITTSLFDKPVKAKAFEVMINDASIFNNQVGFRRIGLSPNQKAVANNISTKGVKTLHFSFATNPKKVLNLTHEYQIGWLESADYSTNQVVVKLGTILGDEKAGGKNIQVFSNLNGKPSGTKTLFTTPLTDGWHNFAFTMDFDKNTIQTYYSADNDKLKAQGGVVPNDMSGDGEYQFGILKKPTDFAAKADITKNGFQEKGITEALRFGGIFMEDGKASLG